MMTILVFIVLGLNLVNLFLDTPTWYTIVVGVATIVMAILVMKNSNVIRKVRRKKYK